MQSQKPPCLLVILTLCSSLLISCGDRNDGNNPDLPQLEEATDDNADSGYPPIGHTIPAVPWSNAFSTRIDPGLALSGIKCLGTEVIEIYWRGDSVLYKCRQDQWLIVIDEKNYCDATGCTEIMVPSFLADLRLAGTNPAKNVAFYHIRPKSPIDLETWRIVHRYWVRFPKNADPQVVPRTIVR